MKIKSSIVVAAAGSALSPNTYAADLPATRVPVTKAAPPAAAWTWTGFYAGAHLGYAWQRFNAAGNYLNVATLIPFSHSGSASGFVGGGQIGYNWQSGMSVFGLEADIAGLTGSSSAQSIVVGGLTNTESSSGKIKWLGTLRGRAGVTFSNTLLYATGGWAYGGVSNSNLENTTARWDSSSTKFGYVVGGGIEHLFMPNWSVRLEGLYVDLGKSTAATAVGFCIDGCQPVTFSNTAVLVRAGLNVKFGP